jgi:hypothetical protein
VALLKILMNIGGPCNYAHAVMLIYPTGLAEPAEGHYSHAAWNGINEVCFGHRMYRLGLVESRCADLGFIKC